MANIKTILKEIIFILLLFPLAPSAAFGQKNFDETGILREQLDSQFNFHAKNKNADSTIYYIDKLLEFDIKSENEANILNTYYRKANHLKLLNKPGESFLLTLSTYQKYCDEVKLSANCKSCNLIYNKLSDFMILLKDYRRGMKYLELNCEPIKPIVFYYKKAELYSILELPDSALITTLEGISIAKQQENQEELLSAYNQHGLIAKRLGHLEEAIKYFSIAINYIDSIGYERKKNGFIIGNLGSCYYELGKLDLAYKYLLEDSKGSLENTEIESYLNAEIILAEIDFKRKQHQKAIAKLEAILSQYDLDLPLNQKLTAIELLMKIFKSINNYSKYDHYSDQWTVLNKLKVNREIESHENLIDDYTAISMRHAIQVIEAEKELLNQKLITQEKEEEKDRLKKWLLISGLITIILILLFIFWRYKMLQTKKEIIKETELKLAKKEEQLLLLKVKAEEKNVQTLSLELFLKQDFSTTLIKRLDQLENISKPELNNIGLFIQNELDVKSTRAQLLDKMGDLSGEFYTMLSIEHPTLTQIEIKLAAMIVMEMTNKEMAISKDVSAEAIKKSKYRLKKKLNLSTTESIEDYLKDLT